MHVQISTITTTEAKAKLVEYCIGIPSNCNMEEELKSLVKVTAWAAASMTYARFASSVVNPGKSRLLALLPAILLLSSLPWHFSTYHFRIVSVFLLVWLAVFKLLLLASGAGPLSPSLPLFLFLAAAALPVKLRHTSKRPNTSSVFTHLILPIALKVVLLNILIFLYNCRRQIPHFLLLTCYNVHLYLALDLVLTSTAFAASFLLGINLDPQFHMPITSDSLQDFWGRRWNLMVTDILRLSVYQPVRSRWGADAGVAAAFTVSGLMHEVLFYYLGIAGPRGEALLYFVLHGVCTVVENRARRRGGGWRRAAHPAVAVLVPVGLNLFLIVTGSCLLLQPLIRSGVDEKLVAESAAVMGFFVHGLRAVVGRIWGFFCPIVVGNL